MKINWFLFCIAFAIAGLSAYGFFTAHYESAYRLVVTIGAFVSLFVPLAGMLALRLDVRGGINVRVLSLVFAIAALIDNLVFTIKIKAWQLALVKLAFGEAETDTSGIEKMLAGVPPEVFKEAGTFSLTPYVIVTGIILLVYLCAAYSVIKALQSAK
jgi:hypothetical protein